MFDILSESALLGGLRRATRGRSRTLLLAVVWAAISAGPAAAAPILDFGPVEVAVSSVFRNGGNSNEDFDGGVVEPFDTTVFSTLVQPDLFFRFPTSPSALPAGFVSAAFSGDRKGGVGTSGVIIRDQTLGQARATFTEAVTNLSDEPVGMFVTYVIPGLEATIFPGSVIGNTNVQAFAAARLNATVLDASGAELSRDRIFTYELGQAPPPPGGDGIFRSADLADEQGDGFLISAAGVRGVEYGSFEGTRFLPTIPVGGTLIFEYQFEAAGSTISREHGFQAFVGDPFDLSAGGGFDIRLAQPSAVPEPATVVLVPGALVALLLARRGRRRRESER